MKLIQVLPLHSLDRNLSELPEKLYKKGGVFYKVLMVRYEVTIQFSSDELKRFSPEQLERFESNYLRERGKKTAFEAAVPRIIATFSLGRRCLLFESQRYPDPETAGAAVLKEVKEAFRGKL